MNEAEKMHDPSVTVRETIMEAIESLDVKITPNIEGCVNLLVNNIMSAMEEEFEGDNEQQRG